jgi:HAD superfamily phosphatase (TIGR01668 family)
MGLRALLQPTESVEGVWNLRPEDLRARGIEGLLLDLDNTVVAWNGMEIPEAVAGWAAEARRQGLRLCICSNARGGGRVRAIAEMLGAEYVAPAGKPGGRGVRRAMEMLGTLPHTTVLVGDQLFTDILAGNRQGLRTVLVEPLSERDFPATKISRWLERVICHRRPKDSARQG